MWSWVWVYRRWLVWAAAGAGGAGFLSALWLRPPARAPSVARLDSEPRAPSPHAWEPPHRLLPHGYWRHRAARPQRYPQLSCVSLPQPPQLQYAAAAWQLLHTHRGHHVYIYGAYWDPRFQEPVVRVLVYCDVTPLPELVCLLWYEDEAAPDKVSAKPRYGWRPEWGGGPTDEVNEPYILACPARRRPPAPQRAPSAVSIVLEGDLCGNPTNILNVQGVPSEEDDSYVTPSTDSNVTSDVSSGDYSSTSTSSEGGARAGPRGSPDDMTFCVSLKWLQFTDDISASLVEWIEFIKEFGASKLFAFMVQVHPNVERVLSYYRRAGFADMTPFTHAPQLRGSFDFGLRDFLDYRRELLPLNDCLYRARAAGCTWLVCIDSDEIIVPHGNYTSWRQVVEAETGGGEAPDALACRNYYFIGTAQRDLAAPPYMHILGHRDRTREPSPPGHSVKSFHNTATVVSMHNHYPMSCEKESCWTRDVNESVARLHHYRFRCGDGSSTCEEARDTLRDDTLARYSRVAGRVRAVLRRLRLEPDT